ncbi:hypothetical protein ACFE04_024099 [Oxalis oulophora]
MGEKMKERSSTRACSSNCAAKKLRQKKGKEKPSTSKQKADEAFFESSSKDKVVLRTPRMRSIPDSIQCGRNGFIEHANSRAACVGKNLKANARVRAWAQYSFIPTYSISLLQPLWGCFGPVDSHAPDLVSSYIARVLEVCFERIHHALDLGFHFETEYKLHTTPRVRSRMLVIVGRPKAPLDEGVIVDGGAGEPEPKNEAIVDKAYARPGGRELHAVTLKGLIEGRYSMYFPFEVAYPDTPIMFPPHMFGVDESSRVMKARVGGVDPCYFGTLTLTKLCSENMYLHDCFASTKKHAALAARLKEVEAEVQKLRRMPFHKRIPLMELDF